MDLERSSLISRTFSVAIWLLEGTRPPFFPLTRCKKKNADLDYLSSFLGWRQMSIRSSGVLYQDHYLRFPQIVKDQGVLGVLKWVEWTDDQLPEDNYILRNYVYHL